MSTYRLTLHISHPRISAKEIESKVDLPVKFSQSVGMPRATKNGKMLGGEYRLTNVSFLLHESPLNFDECPLEFFLKNALERVDVEIFEWIHQTGGSSNFLLGIYSDKNVMFELDIEAIGHLGEHKVSFKFDFYGGEE